MLCHKCTGIHFRRYKDCSTELHEALGRRDSYNDFYYLHSVDTACLERTARSGCQFCITIQHRLATMSIGIIEGAVCHDQIVLRVHQIDWSQYPPELDPWGISCVFVLSRRGLMEWKFVNQLPAPFPAMLRALACPESAPEYEMFAFQGDTSTLSEANMILASNWAQSCLKDHTCSAADPRNSNLPTRIIHIQDLRTFVLEKGGDRRLGYLALSYKWGQTERYLTSTENLAQHYEKIPWEKMPKTFLDAIHVTYRLGFKYLWIDALCIIHNDPDDLREEISRMDSVYRDSTITIFAEAGDDANAGLSFPRDSRASKPCKLNFRVTLEDLTFSRSAYACYQPISDKTAPLYRRGWVLQEEVLASRRLKFGHDQMKWGCQHFEVQESLPAIDYVTPSIAYDELVKLQHHGLLSWIHNSRAAEKFKFNGWYSIMTDYCGRSLTYSTDILPAIGGIASIISGMYQLSYINGLWREDLSIGLLWYVGRDTTGAEVPRSYPTALDKPDAPSWTWISQWGKPIRFCWCARGPNLFTTADQLEDSDKYDTKIPCNRRSTPLNQLIGFQEVDTRPLSITGYLIKGTVCLDVVTQPYYRNGLWERNVYTQCPLNTIGSVSLDSDPLVEPILDITCCLCVIPDNDEYDSNVPWLALISTGQPGVYKRVGAGCDYDSLRDGYESDSTENLLGYLPPHWQNARKETIKLV